MGLFNHFRTQPPTQTTTPIELEHLNQALAAFYRMVDNGRYYYTHKMDYVMLLPEKQDVTSLRKELRHIQQLLLEGQINQMFITGYTSLLHNAFKIAKLLSTKMYKKDFSREETIIKYALNMNKEITTLSSLLSTTIASDLEKANHIEGTYDHVNDKEFATQLKKVLQYIERKLVELQSTIKDLYTLEPTIKSALLDVCNQDWSLARQQLRPA